MSSRSSALTRPSTPATPRAASAGVHPLACARRRRRAASRRSSAAPTSASVAPGEPITEKPTGSRLAATQRANAAGLATRRGRTRSGRGRRRAARRRRRGGARARRRAARRRRRRAARARRAPRRPAPRRRRRAPAGGRGACRRRRANGLCGARCQCSAIAARAAPASPARTRASSDEGLGRGGHLRRGAGPSVRNRSHSRAKRSSLAARATRRSNAAKRPRSSSAWAIAVVVASGCGGVGVVDRVAVLGRCSARPAGSGTAPGSRARRRRGASIWAGTTRTNASMYWMSEPSNVVRNMSVRGAARRGATAGSRRPAADERPVREVDERQVPQRPLDEPAGRAPRRAR